MNGIEGMYTEINTYINQVEADGVPVISTAKLLEHIKDVCKAEIEAADREWLVETVIKSAMAVGLASRDYRSVIHGDGYYMNPNVCIEQNLLAPLVKIYNNQEDTIRQDEQVLKKLKQLIDNVNKSTPGQLCMDADGKIVEEITVDEIKAFLEVLAGDVECG